MGLRLKKSLDVEAGWRTERPQYLRLATMSISRGGLINQEIQR